VRDSQAAGHFTTKNLPLKRFNGRTVGIKPRQPLGAFNSAGVRTQGWGIRHPFQLVFRCDRRVAIQFKTVVAPALERAIIGVNHVSAFAANEAAINVAYQRFEVVPLNAIRASQDFYLHGHVCGDRINLPGSRTSGF